METQTRILTKSHELFMLYGIRSVSMDEIANHLGMSKKTIYQYFKDKDSLVEGVINIEIQIHHDEHMNPSVMFDLQKYHSTAFEKFRTHKNTFFYAIIKANIERGKVEGLYRPELDVDILTRLRLANMFLMFDFEHFPSTKFTPIEIITETTDNFLHGMSTQAGLKTIEAYKQERKNK